MPRLPDREALGGPESLKTGRAMAEFPGAKVPMSVANTGAGAIGTGLENLGGAVAKIGAADLKAQATAAIAARKQADSLDLIKADAYHDKYLTDAERGFQTDPNYKDYDLKFAPLAGTITDDAANLIANPALREKWLLQKAIPRNENARNRILTHGNTLASEDKQVEVENALKSFSATYSDPNADDARRAQVLKDMEGTVNLAQQTGLLHPNRAQAIREKYIDGAVATDAEQRLWTDPDKLINDLTSGDPRYAMLAPDKRHALITRAKTAQSEVVQQHLADDIASIRATGSPLPSDDGTTSLDRASRVLNPNQLQKARHQWDEATREHQAISPLKDLPADAALEHLQSLTPNADTPDYGIAAKLQDKASKAYSKIEKQRLADPAEAVKDAPEVINKSSLLKSSQSVGIVQNDDGSLSPAGLAPGADLTTQDPGAQRSAQALIEARLAAQTRLKIPAYQQQPITKREALSLLQLPSRGSVPDEELPDKLIDAANRAEAIYGHEYALQVMKAAMGFYTKMKGDAGIKSDVISKILTDENALSDLFAAKPEPGWFDWFGGGGQPTPFESQPGSEALSQTDQMGRGANVPLQGDRGQPYIGAAGDAGSAQPRKEPTPKQIEWVQQDPHNRQATFDAEFGAGAYAKAISGGQGARPFPSR